jgi:ribosomal 50S subunit-recycling heat shock protein
VRLDLYLKATRLVKRRAVARALCDAGQVLVGGTRARAGRAVRVGDRVEVRFPRRRILVEVVSVSETERPEAAGQGRYRLLREKVGLTGLGHSGVAGGTRPEERP